MRSHFRHPGILREQWPLLLLLAVLALVWLVQLLGPDGWADRFMVVPAEVAHSWNNLHAGAFVTTDLATIGTLLSYAFLHADIEHLLFNAFYLWIFAALAIRHLGKHWFVAIYVLTAIAGGILHTALDPGKTIPMLGASGAVMGFEGAYLGLALRYRLDNPHIWPMAHPIPPAQLAVLAVIGLVFDFQSVLTGEESFVAHGAHIGGFVMGLFITSFVRADEEPR
jgi:membrane associated rhomboid family serine protease